MSDIKKFPVFSKEEVSDNFIYSFCKSSTLVADCTACGRVFFCESGQYEEGELEELQSKMSENPEKYHERGDYIKYFNFGDEQIVLNCPCGKGKIIEDLILENKNIILDFYEKISEEELSQAQSIRNKVKKVKAQVKKASQ